MSEIEITPELLLNAYAAGIFPMSEDREDNELFWVDPDERGIIPLKSFHISRSLKKLVKQDKFRVTIDKDFRTVMRSCAAPARGRETTWINETIEDLYCALHRMGFAHSIECWIGDDLVGGLYGVSLRGGFFGESMFHRERDASKVALVHLVARLKAGHYSLLDTQFITGHLSRFGATEIPRGEYHARLRDAMSQEEADIYSLGPLPLTGAAALQLITQTS